VQRLQRFFRRTKQLPSLAAYALWAESYPPVAHNGLMEIEQAAMLRLMPDLTEKHVLDLACGSGRYCLIAQLQGAAQVIGVDNSVAMLNAAIHANVNCHLVQAPMSVLPFASHTFDVVVCGLATGHLQPDAMSVAFAEIARVLFYDGLLLFSDFHPTLYAHGGRRTFTASDGRTYEVEHYPHTLEDYVRAVETAGLVIDAIEEPVASNIGVPAVLAIRCKSRLTASD
jgi:malonyl-CoA O-methyltransferase